MTAPPRLTGIASHATWTLRLLWRTNRWLLVGLFITMAVQSATPAGLALFGRGIVNAVVAQGQQADVDPAVMRWIVFGLVVTLAEALSLLARRFLHRRLRDDVNVEVSAAIMAHADTLELAFFEDSTSRETIERAQDNSAGHISQFINESLRAATNGLQVVSLAAILFVIEPLVLVVVGAFAIPYLVLQWRLAHGHYRNERSRTVKKRWTRYFVGLMTDHRRIPEVKMLGLGPHFLGRFQQLMRGFRDEDRALQTRGLAGSVILVAGATVALFALFARVIGRVVAGVLTVGDVAVFGAATARLRSSAEMMMQALSAAGAEALYVGDLRRFLELEPQRRHQPVAPESTATPGLVQVRDVSFSYPGTGEPALEGVSLEIAPGETVGLVGENGAGKTTLVKLICGLYEPTAGTIRIGGTDIRDLPREALRQEIAFVFQDFGRYEATVGENIALGDWQRLGHDRGAVEAAARTAGIHGEILRLPEAYDTRLGRLFGRYDLSGGQWQRLAFARALARNAPILVLDEPTASLDAATEFDLFERFRARSEGRTALLISHRFSTLRMADRLLVMEAGRIVERGTHRELMAEDGLYARLYRFHATLMESAADTTAS